MSIPTPNIASYVNMKIADSAGYPIADLAKQVITATRWNELFNLVLVASDYHDEAVDLLAADLLLQASTIYVDGLDAANVKLTGNQTIAGIKTFSSSPLIPAPTTDLQAATKKYVDDVGALRYTKTELQTSGQAQVHWGNVTSKPTDFEFVINAKEYGLLGNDSANDSTLLNTLITNAGSTLTELYFPYGTYKLATNVSVPSNFRLIFAMGAMLKPANGVVITGSNAKIEAGLTQIFDLSLGGTVGGTWDISNGYPEWFGAIGDGVTDDYTSMQACANICKTIIFSPKSYLINSNVNMSNVGHIVTTQTTEIIGTGIMSGFDTNSWHTKNRSFYVAKPSVGRIHSGGTHYGESALSAEIVPEDTFIGNAVGVFSSAEANDNTQADVWGMNTIATARAGYSGIILGMEIDLNNYSSETANTIGLGITGIGTNNIEAGLTVGREDTTKCIVGVRVTDSITGVTVTEPTTGLIVTDPITTGVGVNGKQDTTFGILVNECVEGVVSSGASTNAIRTTGSAVGLEVSDASTVGVKLNGTGVSFSTNGSVFDMRRFVRTVSETIVVANSTVDITYTPTSSPLSVDDVAFVVPYFTPPEGITWSCFINGNSFKLRLSNVKTTDITVPEGIWLFEYVKMVKT